ncbi:uncharacterized protein K489DRAFT_106225 [Dissoconium aciculare CBS 342.82]|uniref:Uncharacterized protein n=1 Tax=Dissoconium aciculare CBS 342.82 TaxID=1314786 RepID=A0A6J3MGR3_9PEZI|nr:uncharacterized protein K489DRAFT_106225 [Dissoconium aciculare CBS 342.82]KAF1826087.1 hypothetical protein K489DRAFT_106225 [Dissoconium aciculare CBS 342.82]
MHNQPDVQVHICGLRDSFEFMTNWWEVELGHQCGCEVYAEKLQRTRSVINRNPTSLPGAKRDRMDTVQQKMQDTTPGVSLVPDLHSHVLCAWTIKQSSS